MFLNFKVKKIEKCNDIYVVILEDVEEVYVKFVLVNVGFYVLFLV